MASALKIFGAILCTFVVVVLVVTTTVVFVVHTEHLKESLTAWISRQTGLDAHIDGAVTLSVRPDLTLRLAGVRLSPPGSSDGHDIFRAHSAELRMDTMSLFKGYLGIDALTLTHPELVLPCAHNGTRFQESFLLFRPFVGLEKSWGRENWGRHLCAAILSRVRPGPVYITNATLACKDGEAGRNVFLDEMNLVLEDFKPDTKALFRMQGRCRDEGHDILARMDMNGTCILSSRSAFILLEQVRAGVTVQGADIPHGRMDAVFSGTLALHPGIPKIVLQSVKARVLETDLFTSSTLHFFPFLWEGGGILNTDPCEVVDILCEGKKVFSPSSCAFRRLDLRAHFAISPQNITIKDFRARLDGQVLHGKVRLSSFALPRIACTLQADRLDLAPYVTGLAPFFSRLGNDTEAADPASSQLSPAVPAMYIPAFLKTLRLRANFKAHELLLNGVSVGNVSAMVRANKGVVRVYPLKMRYRGGRISGNLRADFAASQPAITCRTEISNVALSENADHAPHETALLGTVSSFAEVTFTGPPWAPDLSSLAGTATLTVHNGTLAGINLSPNTSASGLTPGSEPSSPACPFTLFSVMAEIDRGIVTTKNLLLRSETMEMQGAGTYDMVTDDLWGDMQVIEADLPIRRLRLTGSARQLRTLPVLPVEQVLP